VQLVDRFNCVGCLRLEFGRDVRPRYFLRGARPNSGVAIRRFCRILHGESHVVHPGVYRRLRWYWALFLVAIITRVPGELSRFAGGRQRPSQFFLEVRLLLLIALGILVAMLFAPLIKTVGTVGFSTKNAHD
jgi:hypothetical protein